MNGNSQTNDIAETITVFTSFVREHSRVRLQDIVKLQREENVDSHQKTVLGICDRMDDLAFNIATNGA